jgi:hypothetical protein
VDVCNFVVDGWSGGGVGFTNRTAVVVSWIWLEKGYGLANVMGEVEYLLYG